LIVPQLPSIEHQTYRAVRQEKKQNPPTYSAANHVSLSPDAKLGLAATGDTITVWTLPSAKVRHSLEAEPNSPLAGDTFGRSYEHVRTIRSLAVDWKRLLVATGNGKGIVRVWSIQTAKCLHLIEVNSYRQNLPGGVTAVAFSPDGKNLYTSGIEHDKDDGIKVWNLETGKQMRTLALQENRQRDDYSNYSLIMPLKGSDAALIRGFGGTAVWDLKKNMLVRKVDLVGATLFAAPADASVFLVRAGTEPKLVLCNQSGAELHTLLRIGTDKDPPTHRPTAMTFSPRDGRLAWTGGERGDLVLWDVKQGKLLEEWSSSPHHESIRAIAVSEDEPRVITGSKNGIVQLWDSRNGKVMHTFELGR
jgi:WD40 repeat protein